MYQPGMSSLRASSARVYICSERRGVHIEGCPCLPRRRRPPGRRPPGVLLPELRQGLARDLLKHLIVIPAGTQGLVPPGDGLPVVGRLDPVQEPGRGPVAVAVTRLFGVGWGD